MVTRMAETDAPLEALNSELNDATALALYKQRYDSYRPGWLARTLGGILVWGGNTVYGKKPSYLKFRAVEVIARVPYHSWESAAFTLLTLFYQDEARALKFAEVSHFGRFAKENETMHVVVISALAKKSKKANVIVHTLIPLLFAFFYFWVAYILYFLSPRSAFELNYAFESHAFEQYDEFLRTHKESLKKKPMKSAYLEWYGRNCTNEYDFFLSVRNDEIIHRNKSIEEIERRGISKH